MFICGREEPLLPNPQLHTVDEVDGRIRLSDFGDEHLNRYSFVWYGPLREFSLNVERLLTQAGGLIQQPLCIVSAFNTRGGEALRSKLQLKQREKAGWTVLAVDEIALTLKEVFLPFAPSSFQEGGMPIDQITFVLGGIGDAISAPGLTPLLPSLKVLAQHGKFAPGKSMLVWLKAVGGQLGYFERSDRDRQGFIVISPYRLPLDDLLKEGIVQQVYDFPEAADVWVLP